MKNLRSKVVLAAAALLPILAFAQVNPDATKEELRRQIGASLTALLGDSSRTVVEKLSAVRPDGAISRNFNLGQVSSALFGRVAPRSAPDCQSTATTAKEPETTMCVLDNGGRDSETGAYTMLAFSKNIGIGDIGFVRRPAFDPRSEALPRAVSLSDQQAYEVALKFLELVGVPKSEIPVLPQGAALPVRSMVVGTADDRGTKSEPIAIQKVVSVPRAFVVPGLLTGGNGRVLNHVIAPGGATIAVGDGVSFNGVQFARIDGWSDAQMDARLDPRLSKTTAVLRDEITDDLYAEGVRKVGSLSILIALRKAYPNPDDPNPPLCPVCGLLLPAVQVIVSQAGAGPTDSSERNFQAPGVIREYDLVDRNEAGRAPR